MPQVDWEELSDIRHMVSDLTQDLAQLNRETRDFFRTANVLACTDSCLKRIEVLQKHTMILTDKINLMMERADD